MDMTQVNVSIISPQGIIYQGEGGVISLPSTDGGLSILANHIPMIVGLKIGAVKVSPYLGAPDSEAEFIAINGGVVEMQDNHCRIMASFAIQAKDIDEARAELNKQKAEAEMQEAINHQDTKAFRRARVALERAINLINISRLGR